MGEVERFLDLASHILETIDRNKYTDEVLSMGVTPVKRPPKKPMTNCGYCGRKLPADATECKGCGAPID